MKYTNAVVFGTVSLNVLGSQVSRNVPQFCMGTLKNAFSPHILFLTHPCCYNLMADLYMFPIEISYMYI